MVIQHGKEFEMLEEVEASAETKKLRADLTSMMGHIEQLEEMTSVLEENKSLQALVKDLQACLLQERHHREDLEVKVLALKKERQQMEVEGQSSTNRPKALEMELGLSHEAFGHLQEAKEKVKGKVEKITEDLRRMDAKKIARLEDDVKEPAKRLDEDVELFGKGEQCSVE
ncbi:peroxisomal and mitochondrial division factor 2-like [Miscanthus floridulus]|uniref:peroxisomal and mitochondrial division factor 2-like n=1 Tax=Miscanthus floridulus TaxID=154761 RepID=UPI0034595CFA